MHPGWLKGRVIKVIERMLGVMTSKRADTRLTKPNLTVDVRKKKQKKEAELLNISSHGLRFKTSADYKIGEKLWFDIQSNDEKSLPSLSIKGKIINIYESGDENLHEYGVSFFRFRFMNEIEHIHYYVHTHVDLL